MTTTPMPPSSSAIDRKPATTRIHGGWWKFGLVGALMCYVIYGAFFIAGGGVGFGRSGHPARIVFFHVPVAILSFVCYAVGTVYAVRYLRRREPADDVKSAANLELGFLFCILATITGSIFAEVQWGLYWNWDPRETSMAVMLLLYASYFVLRTALNEDTAQRARLSAVYAIVALVPAIFLIWVVPRIPYLESLHPPNVIANTHNTSPSYKAVLYPSFLAFTMLYIWLLQLRIRFVRLCEIRSRRLAERTVA
jgi:heme exporter protein C